MYITTISHDSTSCNLTACAICHPPYVNITTGNTWTFIPDTRRINLPYDLITLAGEKFLPLRNPEAQRAFAEFLQEAADMIQNAS